MATKQQVDLVELVRHKGPMVLPEKMTYRQAISFLEVQEQQEEQYVNIHGPIGGAFFADAAHATYQVLKARYGYAQSVPIPSFFGDEPPNLMTVATSLDTAVEVPYGRFKVPGVEGNVESGSARQQDRLVFTLEGTVKRKHEDEVKDIVQDVKNYVRDHSIYRGQAFAVKWNDANGFPLPIPEPRFLRLYPGLREKLIFNQHTMDQIETSLFTPVERTEEARLEKMSLKRGYLLHGQFGVGKSMTAQVLATLAVQHGWTFIGVEDVRELAQNLQLGPLFQPCIFFCEDIDRVMSGEDRTVQMDEILNLIDGIEAKESETMVVLTSNDVTKINKALLRPGRLDNVIHLPTPNAEAAERMLRMYGGEVIPEGEDLTAVAGQVAGAIPAVLRELVDHSKWAGLKRTPRGEKFRIGGEALLEVSLNMKEQMELLKVEEPDTRSERVKAAQIEAEGRIKAAAIAAGIPVERALEESV